MLPVKKLYIDSKFRTADSKSTSSFSIDLKESLTMPDNALFFVDDVVIPHSWYLINSNNRKLYLRIFGAAGQTADRLYVVELDEGNYDGEGLANHVAKKIRFGLTPNIYDEYTLLATANYDPGLNIITLWIVSDGNYTGASPTWKILSDAEINAYYGETITSRTSANKVLGITDLTTPIYNNTTPLLTKQVNFQPTSYVTIRSPNLGTFMTLDSNGGRTIIKKVPVSSERGQNIIDNSHANDPLDCSRMTLRNMELIITDESGNELDLGGQNISFTINFLLGPKQ